MAYHRLCLDVAAALQTPLQNHEEGTTGSEKYCIDILASEKRLSLIYRHSDTLWAPIIVSSYYIFVEDRKSHMT
jgi:hypothetical protein